MSHYSITRWIQKFANAWRGIVIGVRGQSSFAIHLLAAVAVVALASWLRVSRIEWLILILCIASVFAAELFNTAIEHLARAITREENPEIRDALDIASGAVLATSLGAAIVGVLVLVLPLIQKL